MGFYFTNRFLCLPEILFTQALALSPVECLTIEPQSQSLIADQVSLNAILAFSMLLSLVLCSATDMVSNERRRG